MANNKRCERLILQIREIARDLSDVAIDAITENASFLELGFDSLFLTQLSASCQKSFGIKITFRQLFNDLPTIAALGAYLDQKLPIEQAIGGGDAEEIPAVPVETMNPRVSVPVTAPQAFTPVLPPVPAQAVPDAATPVAPRVLDEQSAAGIEGVLVRQLELMEAQLQLLQGLPPGLVAGVTAPQTSVMSALVESPATVAPAAPAAK